MEKSKVLINVNNLSEIDEYKKVGISNFLFPVKDLSMGYQEYELDSIPDNSYLLINRVFDTETLELFKSIIDKLDRFKGVVFEDLSVLYYLKDKDIELIWNQAHFVTNYASINYYLNHGCTSAVISNEITKEEIEEIVKKSDKKVILNVLGKNMVMYSRRTLVSNFNKYSNIDNVNGVNIEDKKTNTNFYLKENKYGTAVFNNTYFNYINKLDVDDNNILYYLVYNLDLEPSKIISIIDGEEFGNDGFLFKKTTYKMKEYDDRRGDK